MKTVLKLKLDQNAASEQALTDQELIHRAQRGDPTGFAALVIRYQDRLFASMVSLVGCPTLAEDLVQDAFVKAFCNIQGFRGDAEFFSWIYRIGMNCRRGYHRAANRMVPAEDAKGIAEAMEKTANEPFHLLELSEQKEMVKAALNRLEPHHRKILILREFECFDYQTISQVLGVNVGTVRSRLSRARNRLRAELGYFVS